jgi:hypothetical protein
VPLGIIEHETLVERSVRIGDHLYAISSGMVTVHELTNPGIRLGEVSIAAESNVAPIPLTMYEAPIEFVALRSSQAGSERPAPRQEWWHVAPARTRYAAPARAAAFAGLSHSRLGDADLVHAIAIDTTSARPAAAIGDAGEFDEPAADNVAVDIDDSEQEQQHSHRRRTAFRPVAARFESSLPRV